MSQLWSHWSAGVAPTPWVRQQPQASVRHDVHEDHFRRACMTKRTALLEGVALLLICTSGRLPNASPTTSVIVLGRDTAALVTVVEDAGGQVTHRLDIIGAVAARLTPEQYRRVAAAAAV